MAKASGERLSMKAAAGIVTALTVTTEDPAACAVAFCSAARWAVSAGWAELASLSTVTSCFHPLRRPPAPRGGKCEEHSMLANNLIDAVVIIQPLVGKIPTNWSTINVAS
ncbi:hypothetical protein DFJ73DRAFT_765500 [Zopfochytrium polystomum]|nr:hypothetical protein DFJ73DRAFT_765500 [Zopfochytrium polystomum]